VKMLVWVTTNNVKNIVALSSRFPKQG